MCVCVFLFCFSVYHRHILLNFSAGVFTLYMLQQSFRYRRFLFFQNISTSGVVFQVYPKIAIPLNVRVNSWFTSFGCFSFFAINVGWVWPRQPPAVFRFASSFLLQADTRWNRTRSEKAPLFKIFLDFSRRLFRDYLQQFYLKARTRGQRKLFKVTTSNRYTKKKLIRKRTTCVF